MKVVTRGWADELFGIYIFNFSGAKRLGTKGTELYFNWYILVSVTLLTFGF